MFRFVFAPLLALSLFSWFGFGQQATPAPTATNPGTPSAKVERKEPVAQSAPSEEKKPWVVLPSAPEMTEQGLNLVLEYEVGGMHQYNRWPHPEYEGDEYSGVTWAIGYDGHQNSRAVILGDWSMLGDATARRLADTQPFYGPRAKSVAAAVKDVTVTWDNAITVFKRVDVARTEQQCTRAFPGFDGLRPGAKDAIRSLVFNRGAGMVGDSRREMRSIRSLVAEDHKDYEAIAAQFRAMIRVWSGKSIYEGMKRRRNAEAALVLLRE